jgi:hypothetical protein
MFNNFNNKKIYFYTMKNKMWIIALLFTLQAQAQEIKWALTLQYDSATSLYTVYGRPDTTFPNWPMATAQITVLLPDTIANNAISIINHNFGGWSVSDVCYNCPFSNGFDYQAVYTNGSNLSIYKDSNIKFFSFNNPNICINGVRLIRNNSETYTFPNGSTYIIPSDNNDPFNAGSDYYNSIGNGATQNVNIIEAYEINTNNYGWLCGPTLVAPLNTTISAFGVKAIDCNALIEWTVGKEVDLDGYSIKHSTNGIDFVEVAYVNATGLNNYSFKHFNTPNGSNFYKIDLIEKGGKIQTSTIIARLDQNCNADVIASLFPNPATDKIEFLLLGGTALQGEKINVQMLDMVGKLIVAQAGEFKNGKLKMNFDIKSLPAANYVFRYSSNTGLINGVIKFSKRN